MQKRLRQAHVAAPDRSQHVLAHVPQPVSSNVFPRIRLGTTHVKLVLILAWTSAQVAAQAQERSSRRAAFAAWEQRLEAGDGVPPGRATTLQDVQSALEAVGIEFIATPTDRPGIRLSAS